MTITRSLLRSFPAVVIYICVASMGLAACTAGGGAVAEREAATGSGEQQQRIIPVSGTAEEENPSQEEEVRGQEEEARVAQDSILHGMGVIGDSGYDEYQGTDNRGGKHHDVTYNRVEMLEINRDVNLGKWGKWGEPRREGYEYNWARSAATSTSMIMQGQHTGLAEQVAAGEVTFVFIGIGTNDFNPYRGEYKEIYSGEMSDEDLEKKIEKAVDNVTLATDTILDAGPEGVAVATFPQPELEPGIAERYPDEEGRQRVAQAVEEVNEGLRAMAEERDVHIVEINDFATELLSDMDEEGYIEVGGVKINALERGNDPHYARLGDRPGHAGTVFSGLLANYYFIEPLNEVFGANIEPLSDEEILRSAGIEPKSSAEPDPDPTTEPTTEPNPTPAPDPTPQPGGEETRHYLPSVLFSH